MAQIDYIRHGKELPVGEVSRRLSVCSRCVFETNGVCDGCGCPLVAKARLSTEECPFGYWDEGLSENAKK